MNPLDVKFECSDLDRTVTIREYLKELLLTLWYEGEGFSGKRPFGNSGWQWDLYKVLIENKLIPGKLDEDNYIEEFDQRQADTFVKELIEKLY
jgi:hypothetical protein